MADKLNSKIPDGPLAEKWTKHKSEIHLVSPNNKRKLEICEKKNNFWHFQLMSINQFRKFVF